MPDEPTCGKCGGVMTPKNARLRPELFLHDSCLPDEFRPVGAKQCPHCGVVYTAEAVAEAEVPGTIPDHKFGLTLTQCPGSGQAPRNPLSDRRPLWKDATPEATMPDAPTYPTECADCHMAVYSDAEAFIHACLHSGDEQWCEWGNPAKLGSLPYIFWPIVARLMEAYKRSV